LLTQPVGSNTTFVNTPIDSSNGVLSLAIFVENPPVILQKGTKKELNPNYYFYDWFYNSFATHGDDIYLFVDTFLNEYAKSNGVDFGTVVYGNTFLAKKGSNIAHMSLDKSKLDTTFNLAKDMGISHIILGKLVEMKTKDLGKISRTTSSNSGFGVTFSSSSTRNAKESILAVEVSVFEVATQQLLFSKNYDFYDIEMRMTAPKKGELVSTLTREAMVDSILNDLEERSNTTRFRLEDSDLVINDIIEVEAYDNKGTKNDISRLNPRIISIQRKGQLIKVNISIKNDYDQILSVETSKSRNKIESFLINSSREVFWAVGSGVGKKMVIRPGEQKDFYITFPHKGGELEVVNLQAKLNLKFGSKSKRVLDFTFKNVETR
jgi:hypothetical protein